MSTWTDNNREIRKSFILRFEHSGYGNITHEVTISVELNPETWRWQASVVDGSRDWVQEFGDDAPDLSARSPYRAASKALEFVLKRVEQGDRPR